MPLQSVKYSIENNGNNEYWNGTSFSSASQVLLTATGTSSWSASFPVANFATTGGGAGSYTLTAIATDTSGSSSTPVTSTFFIDENPTNTVFVAPSTLGGSNSNSGLTSSAAQAHHRRGVAAAASAGRTVVAVAAASGGSTYAESALTLTSADNNMSIEGGWSTTPQRAHGSAPRRRPTSPRSLATRSAVTITGASNVTLQQLTVNGLDTGDAAGTSIYGVLVQSSTGVSLQGVTATRCSRCRRHSAGGTGTAGCPGLRRHQRE